MGPVQIYHIHMVETVEFSVDYLKEYIHQARNGGIEELKI